MIIYPSSLVRNLAILLLFLLDGAIVYSQSCIHINSSLSSIILNQAPPVVLPNNLDTVSVPCNRKISNFNIVLEFAGSSETYFEDSTELTATLIYKSSTFILAYDKSTNSLRLPNDQPNLHDGIYNITLFAKDCMPSNTTCTGCSFSYMFRVVYNNDAALFVTIDPTPNPPTLTCLPDSKVVLNGSQLPTNAFKAQWAILTDTQFVDISGANQPEYIASQAGTYRYSISGPAGCNGNNIINVNPPQFPQVLAQPDTQLLFACMQALTGISIFQFGGPDNITFNWTASNNGIIVSGGNTINPVVGSPGLYSLVVTRKDNGCSASTSVVTKAGTIPVISAAISRDPATGRLDCQLKEIKLSATASQTPTSSPFIFNWSDGSTGTDLIVDNPGMYSVTATATTSGCQGTAAILITQDLNKPVLQILSARDTICDNQSVTLTALTQEPVKYLWDDNSQNSTNTVLPLVNGPNTYSVTITANDNGCTNSMQKAIVQVDPPQVFCQVDKITISNGEKASLDCSTSGDRLTWLAASTNIRNIPALGDGPVSEQLFQLDNPQAPGKVEYALYGVNAGCTSARADVEVTVLPISLEGIYIPELITPNGDGLNDRWEIVVPETITNPEAYTLRLFNRYGAQVYEETLAGDFNAEIYPDGTYYYVLSTPSGSVTRGAVTILRRR